MYQIGAWDFAGGMVVHEAAGFSSFAAMVALGRRAAAPPEKPQPDETSPHSLPLVVLGTGMLWFGWFGFNGGSALAIGGLATIAFVNTQIAPSMAMVTWLALDWLVEGKPSLLGACSGAVAGLVVITPSAGFVQPAMAMLAGVLGSLVCFTAVRIVKKSSIDDACDCLGVHGVGGFLGTILVGIISDPSDCLADSPPEWCANPGTCTRSWYQTWVQSVCAVASATYCAVATYLLMQGMFLVWPRLSTWEEQETTRDEISFNEVAYKLDEPLAIEPDVESEQDSSSNFTRDSSTFTRDSSRGTTFTRDSSRGANARVVRLG